MTLNDKIPTTIARLITHISVDLDAVCSVWAAQKFITGADKVPVAFMPANWDGTDAGPGDLILDMDANGKGIKGERETDGTTHSCFAGIVRAFAPEADQRALEPLVRYVDAQDTSGSVVEKLAPDLSEEVTAVLAATGLNAVLRALQRVYHSDIGALVALCQVLDGMLESGRERVKAEEEADNAEMFGPHVALLREPLMATTSILFKRGIKCVVYRDGHNLGVSRAHGADVRLDHPSLKLFVSDHDGEGAWFAHPAGFLLARGTRKAPAATPSNVEPRELARLVEILCQGGTIAAEAMSLDETCPQCGKKPTGKCAQFDCVS